VLGQFGNYAICGMDDGQCLTGFFQNGNGRDVAIGDVDGDGQQEAVLLLENADSALLFVLEFSDGAENYQGPAGHDLLTIDVGDPNGDGVDEIFGLQAGGSFSDAQMHAYSAMGGAIGLVNSQVVDDDSIDLSFGDLDMDDRDELLVLREGSSIELFRGLEGSMQLTPEFTHALAESTAPTRIASVDFDGDSPRTTLMNDEPVLVPGPVVPLIAAMFPPYEAEYSDGTSDVSIGRFEMMSEGFSDSLSLDMGVDMGVSVGLFDIVKAGLGTRISTSLKVTETQSLSKSTGTRFAAEPESYFEGEPYGIVSLTCGCFHVYKYRIEDPAAALGEGADQEEFVLTVPVGGTESLWSTRRYNAMAEATGDLPIIEVPYQVGNPDSYPTAPETLAGAPIPTEDFVFAEPPNILVSDAGVAGFRLSVEESQTNEVSMSTSISMRLDLSSEIPIIGGGVNFGADLGVGWGQGYSLTIGEGAYFWGSLPAIPDNPDTPEDEYLDHAFAMTPFVYRQHYSDPAGEDASYYVLSYAVAQD